MVNYSNATVKPEDTIGQAILELITSFSSRAIALSVEEIHLLLTHKATRDKVKSLCANYVTQDIIEVIDTQYYFVRGKEKKSLTRSDLRLNNNKKLLKLISKVPGVHAVYLTGSRTFRYSNASDDIDICIVTKPQMLFIARTFCVALLWIWRKKRTPHVLSSAESDALCLNIFIEYSALRVPYPKQTLYSARELVHAYNLTTDLSQNILLNANLDWVSTLLPNLCEALDPVSGVGEVPFTRHPARSSFINTILAIFQLWFMKSKVTNEIVTTQSLWLHPDIRAEYST